MLFEVNRRAISALIKCRLAALAQQPAPARRQMVEPRSAPPVMGGSGAMRAGASAPNGQQEHARSEVAMICRDELQTSVRAAASQFSFSGLPSIPHQYRYRTDMMTTSWLANQLVPR